MPASHSREHQKSMLDLARRAIMAYPNNEQLRLLYQERHDFGRGGVFVSVYVDNDLRGCIGNLEPLSLQEGIIENAIHAAYHDTRFSPITKKELPSMNVHINLLTEPKPYAYKTTKELLERIKGEGVIIERRGRRATFLPSVWEQLPLSEEFLSHLCMKAGLPAQDWKEKGLSVMLYQSEEFSERP
ncbi:MAG: AmmeMemoRadiSam system protein A [archaeon]